MLEGFRRDTPIRDLCRREGIRPSTYYAWLKDFMEAGKERLTRDTVRDATRQEINEIKRESTDLKHLVADLSPGSIPSQKNGYSSIGSQRRRRMSAVDKAIVLAQVENKFRGKRQALMALGIPKSSYYRWRRCAGHRIPLRRQRKTVEPYHSRIRKQDTDGSPRIYRAQQPTTDRLDHR